MDSRAAEKLRRPQDNRTSINPKKGRSVAPSVAICPEAQQQHHAGEKVFVDFCDGIALIDPETGKDSQRARTMIVKQRIYADSFKE